MGKSECELPGVILPLCSRPGVTSKSIVELQLVLVFEMPIDKTDRPSADDGLGLRLAGRAGMYWTLWVPHR